MWASMVPSPKGTSVMIWFIRTAWAGGARLPGVLLADLLGRFEPLVGQEWVLAATAAYLQDRCVGRAAPYPRLHCACRKSCSGGSGRARTAAWRRAMACSSAATECTT